MTLRRQLFLLQSLIVLLVIVGTGVTVAWAQENQLRESYKDRMAAVAKSVATLPAVLDAFDDADPAAVIQPIAEVIRNASDVDYVVVSDDRGIRFSHPDPALIGEKVSTPPDALGGKVYEGTQEGTLGLSWRVKVPVFRTGTDVVIGQVSVGILESDLRSAYLADIGWLGVTLGAAAMIAMVLSTGVGYLIRRRIYGLEPDEIKAMLDTRDATLHGIGDGIVVLDPTRTVVLCNDAALRLLGRTEADSPVGRQLSDVLALDLDDAAGTGQKLALAGERVLVARVDPITVDAREVGTVIILMDRTELDAALRDLAGAQSMAEALRAQQHEFANTLHTLGGLLELGEYEAAGRFLERAGGEDADHGPLSASIGDLEVAALLVAKRARARERGVTLDLHVPRPVASAAEDSRDRITVIGNLVDNAVEAVGAGGTVSVGLEETEDGDLTVTVDDDGPGVPVAERASVFSLEHSSKGDGSSLPRGYGLTLVERVVHRVGGGVSVTDSPLGGARFTVTLPRQTEAEQAR